MDLPLLLTCPKCGKRAHVAGPGEGGAVGALVLVDRKSHRVTRRLEHPHFVELLEQTGPTYALICEVGCARSLVQWDPEPRPQGDAAATEL